jgi:hypothetical protein
VSLISDVTEEYRIRRALELNEERLKEAQRIGRFGWWEYRPETNMYIGSEEISRIFNDEPTSSRSLPGQHIVCPSGGPLLPDLLHRGGYREKERGFSLTYRIITPQGR